MSFALFRIFRDHRLSLWFILVNSCRASVCYACRARYCCGRSICLCFCPSVCLPVLLTTVSIKRTHTSSHFPTSR